MGTTLLAQNTSNPTIFRQWLVAPFPSPFPLLSQTFTLPRRCAHDPQLRIDVEEPGEEKSYNLDGGFFVKSNIAITRYVNATPVGVPYARPVEWRHRLARFSPRCSLPICTKESPGGVCDGSAVEQSPSRGLRCLAAGCAFVCALRCPRHHVAA